MTTLRAEKRSLLDLIKSCSAADSLMAELQEEFKNTDKKLTLATYGTKRGGDEELEAEAVVATVSPSSKMLSNSGRNGLWICKTASR